MLIITATATTEIKMAATISPVGSEGEVVSKQLVGVEEGRRKQKHWSEEGEREGGKQVGKRGRREEKSQELQLISGRATKRKEKEDCIITGRKWPD